MNGEKYGQDFDIYRIRFENNKGAQVVGAQLFTVNKEENGAGLQNSIYKHE